MAKLDEKSYRIFNVLNSDEMAFDEILRYVDEWGVESIRVRFFGDVEREFYIENYGCICDLVLPWVDEMETENDVFDISISTYRVEWDFIDIWVETFTD